MVTLLLLPVGGVGAYMIGGPWLTLVVVVLFIVVHPAILAAIYFLPKRQERLRFASFDRLRFKEEEPAAGQLCKSRLYATWEPIGSNPPAIYMVTAVTDDQTLSLQLIRSADKSKPGRLFRGVPAKDLAPIEA